MFLPPLPAPNPKASYKDHRSLSLFSDCSLHLPDGISTNQFSGICGITGFFDEI
jgi:hypothetical protein